MGRSIRAGIDGLSLIGRLTNDALSTKSDNDCLADCSGAMDSLLDYSVQTPLIVCSVPPTRNQRGQRRVTMINTLLKYKCDMNNRLLFVDTGLTLSDIGNDGVHLTDSGKSLPGVFNVKAWIFTAM